MHLGVRSYVHFLFSDCISQRLILKLTQGARWATLDEIISEFESMVQAQITCLGSS